MEVHSFSLDIYSPDGSGGWNLESQIYLTTCSGNATFPSPDCSRSEVGGSGTAGYIMTVTLDAGNELTDFFNNPDWRIGATSLIKSANDGQENYYLVKINTEGPPTIVPEPSTLILLGAGLLGFSLRLRRQKDEKK